MPGVTQPGDHIRTYLTPAEYSAIKAHCQRSQSISDSTREALLAACRAGSAPDPPLPPAYNLHAYCSQ